MATQKKELAKAKGTEGTAVEIPDFITQEKDLGTDDIQSEDIQMPRLKLCNPSTKVDKEELGLKDGQYFDPSTGKVYGDTLLVYVVLTWKSKVWFSDEFKLLCTQYTNRATGETTAIGSDTDIIENDPKAGKDSYNYMLITEEEIKKSVSTGGIPFPIAFSTVSTANKAAKQLNGKFTTNKLSKIPIYCQLIEMSTEKIKNKKGSDFYIPKFRYPRLVSDKEEFEVLKQLYIMAKDLKAKVILASGNATDDDIPF